MTIHPEILKSITHLAKNDPNNNVEILLRYDQTQFPDKPAQYYLFYPEKALALLLADDQIVLNTFWFEKDWPEAAQAQMTMAVNCGDVFVWGAADAERIMVEDIELIYRLWNHDPKWGLAAFVVWKRKRIPQAPVHTEMAEQGWVISDLINSSKDDLLTRFRRGPTEINF